MHAEREYHGPHAISQELASNDATEHLKNRLEEPGDLDDDDEDDDIV